MKIDNNDKKQKINANTKYVLTIIFLLIIILVFIFKNDLFYKNDIDTKLNSPIINLKPPTIEQKQNGEEIKNQNDTIPVKNDLDASMTIEEFDTDVIKIKTIISGAISDLGNCELELSQGSKKYEFSAKTFALTSYSTCMGFDIEKQELNTGEWQVKLSITIDDKNSSIIDTIAIE